MRLQQSKDCSKTDEDKDAKAVKATLCETIPIYVKQFRLFLDSDRVLRCKARLKNTSVYLGSKNPILLPKKPHFAELLIHEIHDMVKYSGIRDTLTTTREPFWIISGWETVKRIIKKCVVCLKAEGFSFEGVTTPDFPVNSVSEEPPFTNVHLDFAFPLFVWESCDKEKSFENSMKVYIPLFPSTRAIHVKLAQALSVLVFFTAFQRYVSRRGLPGLFISDNAKTFRAASAEIRKSYSTEEV